MIGRLQMWLQGCGPNYRQLPWPLWRLGNLISTLRYWTWRARGGTHEEAGYREMGALNLRIAESTLSAYYVDIDLVENATTNTTHFHLKED